MFWLLCGAFAIILALGLLRVYFTNRKTPLWLPQEDTYIDPATHEELKFSSLFDTPTIQLSIIVPAYNEEERLTKMLDEMFSYLEKRCEKEAQFSYEVIVVSDGSKDKTAGVAREYEEKRRRESRYNDRGCLRVLDLKINRGKGGAVRRGMMYGRGKYLLMVDADGATKFSDLDKLETSVKVQEKQNSNAIAVGSRAHLQEKVEIERKWLRNLLMHGFHFAVAFLCVRGVRDTQCGFKLFTRKAAQILFPNLHVERWAFDVELLYMARSENMYISEIAVEWQEVDGSKLNPLSASIQMARDLVRIRAMHALGIWNVRKQTVEIYRDYYCKTK